MSDLINYSLTYLNPISFINMLWDFVLDCIYMLLQLLIDTLVLLLAAINWICPVMPNLSPPSSIQVAGSSFQFSQFLRWIAWIIPWDYAVSMIIVMIGCTMFAIMTTWTLRWAKVIR